MDHIKIFAISFIMWNTIVFLLYGIDKRKAKKNKQRISEKTLLLSAAFMGEVGALFGMYVFRHKTQYMKFKIGVPLLLILNIAVVAVAIWLYIKYAG